MAQSLMRLLTEQTPGIIIDVLAPKWTHPILARMPEINATFVLPISANRLVIIKRFQIARMLNKRNYQQAYVLPSSFKSALIPWLAGIPIRTGRRGEMRYGLLNDIYIVDKKKYPLWVQHYLTLGLERGDPCGWKNYYPKLASDKKQTEICLQRFELTLDKPVLILCPGAKSGYTKCWPELHYAAVANHFLKNDWQVWILGGKAEEESALHINSKTDHQCKDLTTTNLEEAVDLISVASMVVCNDSGPMHIAAGLQRPIVAIYGSSSPRFTPPLCENTTILSLDLECQPCFKSKCPLKHHRCMKEISPEMVINKIRKNYFPDI
jgi:heptosyltransferase II